MNIGHLTGMVNDISHYFAAEPGHAAGVAGVAEDLRTFRDPVIRRQIVEHLKRRGEGL